MKKKKMYASVKEYGKNEEIFVVTSENYSTKKDFTRALKRAGLVVKHISTEEEI